MSGTPSSHFESVRLELDAVRMKFLRLLDRIGEDDWDRRLSGDSWTVRQEMTHLVQVLRVLPAGIRRASGGGRRSVLSVVPTGLRSWINGQVVVPWLAQNATRRSLAEEYEKAHMSLLNLLGALPGEAWSRSAPYPRKLRTVEQMAHRPAEHFEEHEPHLRAVLRIKKGVLDDTSG